jgi:DNA-binding response OmpR family regulator
MKVLICDDDPTALTRTDLSLKKLGYETVVCPHARDALTILTSPHPPKLAIIDWMMPEYSGLDICRKVREISTPVSIYIIVLTARDQPEDVEEALSAGANDFISKPFAPLELKARIGAGARIVGLEAELKTLTGLLPICSWCKKIRQEDGKGWVRIEEYVQNNSYAQFSHGGCPECLGKWREKLRNRPSE